MKIAVIDYGIGNLFSAYKALVKVGAPAYLVSRPEELAGAQAVVLPGVGDFGACMAAFRERGFEEPFRAAVDSNVPILGICVGMQMLFDSSEEAEGSRGLGILPGRVERLKGEVRLPQMQWNRLRFTDWSKTQALTLPSRLFRGLEEDESWFYFVHSFAAMPSAMSTALAEYGGEFSAAVGFGNVMGTQFHPEKSSTAGLRVLTNFVELCLESEWL